MKRNWTEIGSKCCIAGCYVFGLLALAMTSSANAAAFQNIAPTGNNVQEKVEEKPESIPEEKVNNGESERVAEAKQDVADDANRPRIQIALLLDTSNSMDGLIQQAKTQLWSIVNNLVETKKNGQVPIVEVALFEYGNDGLPVTEDYLRQVIPLTTDLDKLSEALFDLKTNGGSEYCGAVIDNATKVLNWRKGDEAYKAIFIAGNEPFSQGSTDYNISCSAARASGIIVNTIHCGAEKAGVSGKWKHGADVGGGRFMVIESDRKVVSIDCPQDKLLIELNLKLNKTYIPYGAHGIDGLRRQAKQDSAQAGASAQSLTTRIASKGNANLYSNSTWDLVDASDATDFKYESLKKESLPAELQKLSTEELKAAVEEQKSQRAAIRKEIAKLAKERAEFLADYAKKNVPADSNTFGRVLNDAAMEQAQQRGFKK